MRKVVRCNYFVLRFYLLCVHAYYSYFQERYNGYVCVRVTIPTMYILRRYRNPRGK